MENKKTISDQTVDLRSVLSETFVLYMKTYALHWNFEGERFYGVHKMTEEQYGDLAEAIDEIAERIRALGESAPVSLTQILEHSGLREFEQTEFRDEAIKDLVRSHRRLSDLTKKAATKAEKDGDPFSHDLMVARAGAHDKFAWLLGSVFQARP